MSNRHLDDKARLADYDELFNRLVKNRPLIPNEWNKETGFVAFLLHKESTSMTPEALARVLHDAICDPRMMGSCHHYDKAADPFITMATAALAAVTPAPTQGEHSNEKPTS